MWDIEHSLTSNKAFDVLSRHKDFLIGFPVQEEESVQLGRGDAVYTTSHAMGRDCLIGYVNVAPKISVSLLLDKGWVNSLIPMSGMADLQCNGWELTQNNFVLMGTKDAYKTVGHGRNNLFLTARISRLQETIAALTGRHIEEVNLRDQSISLPPLEMSQLRRIVWDVLNLSAMTPEFQGHPRIDGAREAYLLSFYAMILAKHALRLSSIQSSKQSALQIMHAVESSWHELSLPPSIAEMCAIAGVSERHLRNCYYEVYGVSPAQHTKLRRLSAARRMLLDRENIPASVKFVAHSYGFHQSGRFAQEYRRHFGETPIQTLKGGT